MTWEKSWKKKSNISFLSLAVLIVISAAVLVTPVLGEDVSVSGDVSGSGGSGEIGILSTHTSHAIVTPNIIPAGIGVPFRVEVFDDTGDPIQEFRIYEHNDFTNFVCDPADNWFGPFYGENEIGKYCQWNAKNSTFRIYPGQSKNFTYAADSPETECCRTWLMETRDPNNFYVPIQPNICIDTTKPETSKWFEGPQKKEGDVEWIDGVTKVVLNATDNFTGKHDNGIDKIWYANLIDLTENSCWNPQEYCEPADVPGTAPYEELECINEVQAYCEENWKEDDYDSWEECVEYLAHSKCNVDPLWKLYDDPFTKKEDSCHMLHYFSVDNTGNVENVKVNCFFVDKTAPTPRKEHGTPFVNDTGFDWVTPETDITFTCTDPQPHPSGDEELCFKVSYDVDPDGYVTEEYCTKYDGIMNDEDYCCLSATPEDPFVFNFNKDEDSLHDLEYYCIDAVEKKTSETTQYYKVDSTPPTITKTMIGTAHSGDCPPGPNPTTPCYVRDDGQNGVHISVTDPDPTGKDCNVGINYCNYGLWWHTTQEECNKTYPGHQYDGERCAVEGGSFNESIDIIFKEDSLHDLHIFCWDKLGNKMPQDLETFLVDSTPPETIKIYAEPYKIEPECLQYWTSYCENSWQVEGFNDYGECVRYYAHKNCPQWISSKTNITLKAEDEKVGVAKIYWANILVEDDACWYPQEYCQPQETNFNEQEGDEVTFNKEEESCHLIQYSSVDKLGNQEDIKWQCVFVDNTPPITRKEVGDPKVIKQDCENGDNGNEAECETQIYITNKTPITLTCIDPAPHPVDQASLKYRYRISEDCEHWGEWTDWIDPVGDIVEKTFYFPEDSCHELEYYCQDHLGNAEQVQREIDIVDTQSPEITKTIIGPWFGDCLPENENFGGNCYIDGVTKIHVEVEDPQPHPVNDVKCKWGYKVCRGDVNGVSISSENEEDCNVDDEINAALEESNGALSISNVVEWQTPPFDIQFPEESKHKLWIVCKDALGNKEVDVEKFYVDLTPPNTTKTYEGPQWPEQGYPKWINSKTLIYLKATDSIGPHDSGVRATWWRNTIVNDEYCENQDLCQEAQGSGNWNLYIEPFQKPEESCHLIEYYSIDNVNKTEEVKKQCVYVDNQAPTPNKTVDEPKIKWDGKDAVFYDIANRCWATSEDGIECWKVTLDTPITLDCVDPQPHPVDQETTCFKVDVDAEDETPEYCRIVEGTMAENGYCCGKNAPFEFYFQEETEHNLKYYCVDALGNSNKENVDEEKFKVLGRMFKIQINKKWNLISVPFDPLNKNVSEVFKDIKEGIDSVWSYNSETEKWYVYRPNDGADDFDNLEEIETGLGYWVLADCETETENENNDLGAACWGWGCGHEADVCGKLIIGGSLFQPAPVVPPSRDLKKGWNLIGYYGTEGRDGYFWPSGNGKKAYCALYSLVDTTIGNQRWSSLLSYWEPKNPNQWILLENDDNMDPGAGYWLEMDVEDKYAPATSCGWLDWF